MGELLMLEDSTGPVPVTEPVPVVRAPTFEQLYLESHADMVRLAYLLTGSTDTAQDLVQDAFVRVHRAYARVQQPHAYLRRAVVNACHSHHRRLKRQRDYVPDRPVDGALGADELSDALLALSPRQRTAIVLRYWHDCSAEEIAGVLRCRPGTVASLLHRGIAQLREVVEL